MTPTDHQADRLSDALHQRVDTMHDAPISLAAVQGRAGRIRRNRRIGAGVGVAAVLAVVAPLGVLAQGQLAADERPLQPAERVSEAPAPVGESTFTTEGLARGERTEQPWIDVVRGVVVAGDLEVSVDMPQDAVRWDGGLLVTGITDGDSLLYVLDEAGEQVGDPARLPAAVGALVGSPARGEVAWVQEQDGTGESGVEQVAVIAADDDLVAAADQVVVPLPQLGGFEPVGIGPDGLVLNVRYPDGSSEVVLAGRDGEVRPVPGLLDATGVHPETGDVAGTTSVDESNEVCAGVLDVATGEMRWESCELSTGAFSPDGRWLLAGADYQSGYGPTSMAVVDATTGELQAGWTSSDNPPVFWMQSTWEDADSILSAVTRADEASLVRFGLDGAAERVTDPLPADPFGDRVQLLPEG